MEFMVLYLNAVLILFIFVALVTLAIWLSIKGLGYIFSIWFGSHGSKERR